MASPRASTRCFACGEVFTKAMFKHPLGKPAQVCNGCMTGLDELPPMPFDPNRKIVPLTDPTADAAALADVIIADDDIATLEVAERILIRRSLLALVNRFHPSYKAGWVHEDICRRLERFMRDVEAGLSPRLLLCMPPRHGKQLADDTPMLTQNRGWTTHGELVPGDFVFTPSGSPAEVVAVSEPVVQDMTVTFSDGTVIECHENHEWRVYDRASRGDYKWRTVDTKYIASRSLQNGARYTLQLPVAEAVEYAHEALPVRPYTFGVWLGDGTSTKAAISCAPSDEDMLFGVCADGYERTSTCVHPKTGVWTAYFHGTLYKALKPFFGEKKIPEIYKRSSVPQRLALVAGLIDSDGHVERSTGRVRIATCSTFLRDDIIEVLTGLGFRPYLHTQAPCLSTSGIQGTKPVFYIGFQPTMPVPTKLTRKSITRFAKQRRVGIISATRTNKTVGRCIQVDSTSGLYLAGKNLTTTHNSTLTSNFFPPFVLGHHPDWEIIAASHTQSLALKFSGFIRDMLRDPAYTAIFPGTVLNPESQSKESWDTMKRGGYLAAGVGTGITGRGAHVLIIDDPIKDMEAADSATIRDSIWEWYTSTAYTRLAPGGGVLGIMTLWNEDDWGGRIIEVSESGDGDKFEVVRYPAINEGYAEYLAENQRDIIHVPPTQQPPANATLLREPNTALHPARYNTTALHAIRKNYYARGNQRTWSALYQQRPTPEDGIFFTKPLFTYYSVPPPRRYCTVYQAWDFAITENQDSDYTVCATIMQDSNDCLYVLDVERFRSDDSIEIVDKMLDMVELWNTDLVGAEDGQIWKTMKAQWEKRCLERKLYPAYEVLQPLTDKKVRAMPLRGRMQLKKVYFPIEAPWKKDCVDEMLKFPGGKHDDQVDALAWAVRLTLSKSAPRIPEPPPQKSWRDKLGQTSIADAGHMAA